MRLSVLLVLVLCVVLCSGDRRRSEHGDGDDQQRVQQRHRDDDERRHHYHDNQRRQHHHRDDEDGNDSDDEDDDDDDHHHHRFVEVADADGGHWGHSHERDHRGGRPEADAQGRMRGQDNRQDGQTDGKKGTHKNGKKNGQKDGHKDGQKKPDKRQGGDRGDSERHQDRQRNGNQHTEDRQHRGDTHSNKNHSNNNRKTHHQNAELPQGRPSAQLGAAEAGPQSDPFPAAGESESGQLPLSPTLEPSSPAAESLAAALSAEEPDTALSGAEEGDEAEAEPTPPPHQDVAAMARYIVHVSDWTAMATISSRPPTRGMPFANVFSVCDGTRYRSTGIPYLYLTDMEISVQDLRVNNSASLTMSLAQTSFCRQRGYDPEDPLCAHVILSGRVLQVDEQDPEYTFAKDALFARHPEMSGWPAGHHFFVAKLDIQNIIVLDYFGGAKTVTLKEYFATDPFKVHPRRANML